MTVVTVGTVVTVVIKVTVVPLITACDLLTISRPPLFVHIHSDTKTGVVCMRITAVTVTLELNLAVLKKHIVLGCPFNW